MANAKNNYSIEEELESLDKMAIERVRHIWLGTNYKEPNLIQAQEKIFKDLFDIHSAMWPLHDILVDSKNDHLTAILAKTILQLNALRVEIKKDKRTYQR